MMSNESRSNEKVGEWLESAGNFGKWPENGNWPGKEMLSGQGQFDLSVRRRPDQPRIETKFERIIVLIRPEQGFLVERGSVWRRE